MKTNDKARRLPATGLFQHHSMETGDHTIDVSQVALQRVKTTAGGTYNYMSAGLSFADMYTPWSSPVD